jgi:ribosome-associated heat shock protein Hsp15
LKTHGGTGLSHFHFSEPLQEISWRHRLWADWFESLGKSAKGKNAKSGSQQRFHGIIVSTKLKIIFKVMAVKEKLRLDKYLWAIRLFKTRSLAADACDTGKVKQNGTSVKASKNVNIGDEYEVKTEARKWLIRVTGLLANRVAFSEAVNHYLDMTPQEEQDRLQFQAVSFHTGKRPSKIGRPTKKQRRELDDFLGEEE